MAAWSAGPDRGEGSVDRGWREPHLSLLEDRQRGGAGGDGRHPGETEKMARTLAWLGLGIGLAQVAAPEKVALLIGIADDGGTRTIMRAVGLREIASGLGILTRQKAAPWLWARVGGDVMDLALLRKAITSGSADRGRVAAAAAAVAGVAAADALCGLQLVREDDAPSRDATPGPERETRVTAAITVNAPAERVFASWDGFQDLPRFMRDLASVELTDARQSHWRRSLPGGLAIDWDVTINNAVPNELIEWRTGVGSGLDASGQIRFRPASGSQGTEVLFEAEIAPPGGELGHRVVGLFAGTLGTAAQNDLRRFKQLIEIGEIVASDDSVVPGPNSARPSDNETTVTAVK